MQPVEGSVKSYTPTPTPVGPKGLSASFTADKGVTGVKPLKAVTGSVAQLWHSASALVTVRPLRPGQAGPQTRPAPDGPGGQTWLQFDQLLATTGSPNGQVLHREQRLGDAGRGVGVVEVHGQAEAGFLPGLHVRGCRQSQYD